MAVIFAVVLMLGGLGLVGASLYLSPDNFLTFGVVYGVSLLALGLISLWLWSQLPGEE